LLIKLSGTYFCTVANHSDTVANTSDTIANTSDTVMVLKTVFHTTLTLKPCAFTLVVSDTEREAACLIPRAEPVVPIWYQMQAESEKMGGENAVALQALEAVLSLKRWEERTQWHYKHWMEAVQTSLRCVLGCRSNAQGQHGAGRV
jgi:hypothetical protein